MSGIHQWILKFSSTSLPACCICLVEGACKCIWMLIFYRSLSIIPGKEHGSLQIAIKVWHRKAPISSPDVRWDWFYGLEGLSLQITLEKLYTLRPKTQPGASSVPLLALHRKCLKSPTIKAGSYKVREQNVFNTPIQGMINWLQLLHVVNFSQISADHLRLLKMTDCSMLQSVFNYVQEAWQAWF